MMLMKGQAGKLTEQTSALLKGEVVSVDSLTGGPVTTMMIKVPNLNNCTSMCLNTNSLYNRILAFLGLN
jgi:hypothetical protein